MPKNTSKKFTEAPAPVFNCQVENDQAELVFNANEYITYQIFDENGLIKEISNKTGEQKLSFAMENERKTLTLKWFYTLSPQIKEEKELVLVKSKTRPNNKRWYM